MESKKSNKIRDIVKLQQILKKWRKIAHASKQNNENTENIINNGGSKSIKFLKRTLSFTDSTTIIPKGYLVVSVSKEEKRYKIPMDYLSHEAFHVLLQEAEEEFGFQQAGVLKIPCEVNVFENILKLIEDKCLQDSCRFNVTSKDDLMSYVRRIPADCPRTPSHQPQSPMCR